MQKLVILEYYRGFAAFGVAICHYFMRTTDLVYPEFLSTLFVEMFFPLSGFVLASQTMLVARRQGSVGIFLARRWMRTLPLFGLALVCVIIILKDVAWRDILLSAIFAKHLTPDYVNGNFYPVAWSLAVEEWYYLLAPIFFAFSPFARGHRDRILILTCYVIGVSCALKIIFLMAEADPQFVRIATYLRLDAIAIGFLFFQLNQRLQSQVWLAYSALVGGAAFGAGVLVFVSSSPWPIWQFVSMIGTSVFFASVITALHNLEKRGGPIVRAVPVSPGLWLGRLSYSIYLFHLVILYIAASNRAEFSLAMYLGICVGVSLLLYYLIEKPIMQARPQYRVREPSGGDLNRTR